MMFNRKFVFDVLLILLITWCLLGGDKVQAKDLKIAIIYDSYNEFGDEENKLNSLVNICLESQNTIELVNTKVYLKGDIFKYDALIILNNNSFNISEDLIEDLSNLKKYILVIGKKINVNLNKNIYYIPHFSVKDNNFNDIRKYIYKFLNGDEEKKKNIYILIDKIYPFAELNEIVKKIDFLYDRGITFICSVMPVYENEHFEAMKNFCQVLRYAQSKGGKIILHSSVLFGENIPGKDVKSKMDLAQQIYINQGVYPLALDVPEGFLYKEDYKELIGLSDTIFLEKDKNIEIINEKKYSMNKFNKIINKIDIKDGQVPKIDSDIAIGLNSDMDFKEFSNNIEKLLRQDICFNDVDYLNTDIKLGLVDLSSKGSDKFLNNNVVYFDENKNEAEQLKKVNGNVKRTIDISTTNKHILVLTFFICIVFAIIVFMSRKIDRGKYFNK